MRVLVAVEAWPGTGSGEALAASEAAEVIRETWLATNPEIQVDVRQLASGNPRSADVLTETLSVAGSVQMATAPGAIWLAPAGGAKRWSPTDLGLALRELAAQRENRTVYIPVGDEAPAGDATELWGNDPSELRKKLASLAIVALVSAARPLLGFNGMSAAVRLGRESDPALAQAAQVQEDRWRTIAETADPVAGSVSLLGNDRLSQQPGTGAAGGLAYCLAVVGAKLLPAASTIVAQSGIGDACRDAVISLTVLPEVSPRNIDHGPAAAIAAASGTVGTPSVLLSHDLQVGRRDLMSTGITSAHTADAGIVGLADGIRRIAQTWTPRR